MTNIHEDTEKTPGQVVAKQTENLLNLIEEIQKQVMKFDKFSIKELEEQSRHLFESDDQYPGNTETYRLLRRLMFESKKDMRGVVDSLNAMKEHLNMIRIIATAVSMNEVNIMAIKINLPFKSSIVLGQCLGFPEKPYLKRWMFTCPLGSIRLHHWFSSDDDRYPHDHSWNFVTFIISGYYLDMTPVYDVKGVRYWMTELMLPWRFYYRKAEHQHYVKIEEGKTCWTLLFTGRFLRSFGFWLTEEKRVKANKYFFKYGHHSPYFAGEPRRTTKISEGYSETIDNQNKIGDFE